VRQENNKSLNAFWKRIRSAIDTLSLAGGDGVLQPTFDSLASASTTFDKDLAEELGTIFLCARSISAFLPNDCSFMNNRMKMEMIFFQKRWEMHMRFLHITVRDNAVATCQEDMDNSFCSLVVKIKGRMPMIIAGGIPMHVFQLILTLELLYKEQMEKYGP
jgi:hypothetical protein